MTNFISPMERRRTDWQANDRRRHSPWVVDINDRRSGLDRRVEAMRHQAELLKTGRNQAQN